jgi:RHS repeat-associated protein
LITRSDRARGSITSNVCTPGYDAFNRPVQKTYNDSTTPPACYSYYAGQDFQQTAYTVAVNGACTAGAVNSYTWSNYDALGRPGTGVESVSGQGTWTFPSVLWTPQGQVSSITYPSGRVVNTSFDPAGRPDLVTGSLNATMKNYVGSATYAAHGALAGMTLGDSVARTFSYNSFLQMTQAQAGSLMTLQFGYSGSNNNGNLLSQSIARPGFAVNQGYWYDGANRLCAGVESVSAPSVSSCSPAAGANWNQLYTFDTVGNRAVTAGSSTLAPNFVPTGTSAFNAKNQWAGAGGITPTYDSAGNLTSVAVPGVTETMTFDAESRMTSFDGATVAMTYDALGRRMTKAATTTGTTVYVYDPAGNLAVESGGAVVQTATLYVTQDHLGSTRLVTNASGTVVGCHDYAPFGEEIPGLWGSRPPCYGPADTAMKFTGQERDPETAVDLNGFDNFQARMLAGIMGRFLSPDPDNAGADPANPQSWNMYSYALNSPLVYVDPDGTDSCYIEGAPIDCAAVQHMASVGAAAQCPNNQCVLARRTDSCFLCHTPTGSLAMLHSAS